jgi:hypothetical protein
MDCISPRGLEAFNISLVQMAATGNESRSPRIGPVAPNLVASMQQPLPLQQQQQSRSGEWKEADVHAWSSRMSEVIKGEWSNLPEETKAAEVRAVTILREANEKMPPQAKQALMKIASRLGATDGDLCGCCPGGLFVLCWENPLVTKEALADCLADVAGTCLQGETHRLFSLLLAAKRSASNA